MPSHQDDGFSSGGENFDLDGIDGHDSESENDGLEPESGVQIQRIMAIPGPNAEVHELRKVSAVWPLCSNSVVDFKFIYQFQALALAQQGYLEMCEELKHVKKEFSRLFSSIPAKKHGRILNNSDALDNKITKEAKKYVMLYHFWVIDGLFPAGPMPTMNPRSPARWASNESRANGALAELYAMVPQDMHETMATYKQFGSVVRIIIRTNLSECCLINSDSFH